MPRDPTAVLGRRGVAYLIDWAITVFVFLVLFFAMAHRIDKRGTEFDGFQECPTLRAENNNVCFESPTTAYILKGGQFAAAVAIPALISLGNLVALQGATGGSIGKQITGLRVVDAHGNIANVGRMIVRWILLVVDSFCVVLGMIVAGATKPHRRVGDFAAGTYVVGRNDVGRSPSEWVAPTYDQTPHPYLSP